MSLKNLHTILHFLCALVLFQSSLLADLEIHHLSEKGKRAFPEIPDFTKGGKKNDKHDWNLGPTGARGWMWGMRLQTDLARQILITKVDPHSPADGLLKVNDVILGVNGNLFHHDARVAFGNAVTEAEKEINKGQLKLLRWRNGKTETINLKLKVMGSYSELSPINCGKSQLILDQACEYIQQKGLRPGIVGYVNALGLLASGKQELLPMIQKYARSLNPVDAWQMSSWNMSYMNIFLSEYYLLTGDKVVYPKLKEMALYLAKGQSLVGTWGHNNVGPNKKLLGYGAMTLPSLSCAVSLVLNQKCGINDPSVNQAIRKSEMFFSSFVDKGNIPYGDHSPREVHDSNGRCSLATIFFDFLNHSNAYEFFARMTIASYGQREEGHTGNYWSFLWGALGAQRAGPEAAAAFHKKLTWFYDLERRWDGGFTYQGGANMSGSEHTTPGWDTTGARLLMYASKHRKLLITGRNLSIEKALVGDALQQTFIAGEHYSTLSRENYVDYEYYDSLSTSELLSRLDTWSTPMRIRASKALAKKTEKLIPQFKMMLNSKKRNTILGGIYALEYQRIKAKPAMDDLVKLLTHHDEWIRFRAGCALCAIGKDSKSKAVPVMLKMAMKTFDHDPRQMNQRYLSFVLWGTGNNGSPVGLLRRDMTRLDQRSLIPAIKKLIRNEDGQTRGYVANAIKLMTYDELKPLWSDLVWAVKNPSPSGIMFNATIQEVCLNKLVKYRFKESIPLLAHYVRHMKQHGSQERIYKIMDELLSFGIAAKSALPELYEALEYYKTNLGPNKPLPFPTWAYNKFMKGLSEGIQAIENTTSHDKNLKSIPE